MGVVLPKFCNDGGPPTKRLRLDYLTGAGPKAAQISVQTPDAADSPWRQLPYVTLVEVYRLLPNRDKFNLSLTCHTWCLPFSRPEVWQRAKFLFNGIEDWRALHFARSFSCGLRHLTIDCCDSGVIGTSARKTTSNLYRFLDSLLKCKNSRLVTLELLNMDRLSWWYQWNSEEDLVRVLGDLLDSQTGLRTLNLSRAGFRLEQGLSILLQAATSCGSRVTTLVINDMFSRVLTQQATFLEVFTLPMQHFTSLIELTLSCQYLSDRLLSLLAAFGSLLFIIVHATVRGEVDQPSTMSWENLKRACHGLQAHYVIKGAGRRWVFQSVLTPGIPLVKLEWHCVDYMGMNTTQACCGHIATCFQNCLQTLCIDLHCSVWWDQNIFYDFIDKCLVLEEMTIRAHDIHSQLQATIERSVRKALSRQPFSRLRRFVFNDEDISLDQSWISCLLDWLLERVD
ncbi:hypothetical protein Btru_072220 [Bulinus truncatus]|nr:hypothetical protein Btru_072220 [Bulinus truncatus]